MNVTNCPNMEILASLVEAHDGKSKNVLRLDGTSFEVRLGACGNFVRSIHVPDIVHIASRYLRNREVAPDQPEPLARLCVLLPCYSVSEGYSVRMDNTELPGDNGRFAAYALALSACRMAGRADVEALLGSGPDSWTVEEVYKRSPRKGAATLEGERTRIAKELRKNKLPKKAPIYGPVPVKEWAENTSLCDGVGYYRPEHESFVGPLRRVFDRRGTGKEAHANALRLSTSDYWQK